MAKFDKRLAIRILLWATLGAAVIVIFAVLVSLDLQNIATWTTIAASSAVITSVISALNGQRVIELQEDALRPHPYPFIDASSRYQLLQLRVKNFGGSSAHDVRLQWDKPLLDSRGAPVQFTEQNGSLEILVLLPNQSIATPINADSKFFNENQNANYSGQISCKDDFGKFFQRPFYVSVEQYRQASRYEEEEQRTHYEIQKIPQKLEDLTQQVKKLQSLLKDDSS